MRNLLVIDQINLVELIIVHFVLVFRRQCLFFRPQLHFFTRDVQKVRLNF